MVCFFETNGSFFKVGDANFESLYFEDVIEIINRLKATVAFMNKIESPEIDYDVLIMEVDFCPVLCILEVPVLQAFRGISHFVWYCKAVSDLS